MCYTGIKKQNKGVTVNYPMFDHNMKKIGTVVSVGSIDGHDEYHVRDENGDIFSVNVADCTLHLNISNEEELEKIQCNTYYKTR